MLPVHGDRLVFRGDSARRACLLRQCGVRARARKRTKAGILVALCCPHVTMYLVIGGSE